MSAPAAPASASADLCGLLAELLSFPGPGLEAAVKDGQVAAAVHHLAGHLGYEVRASTEALAGDLEPKELEFDYIRLFDIGDKVPTPLYTGVYSPRRRDAMEELLRFYRFFGLTTEGGARDLPDFVPTVLEFLGFLALGIQAGDEATAAAMATARADVLERHLRPWATQTASRLDQREAHPFYRSVVGLVKEMVDAELYLARVQPGSSGK